MDARERGRLLYKLADLVEKHSEELAASKRSTTANRFRNREPPTCLSSSTVCDITPVGPIRFTVRRCRFAATTSATLNANRSASAARSSLGTSPCLWRHGSGDRRSPPVAPLCSSLRNRRRFRASTRRTGSGSRFSGWRYQYRFRLRRHWRRAGQASASREDCVHRTLQHGPDHRTRSRRNAQAIDVRAGRQESEHCLRRRRPRRCRRGSVCRDLP